jgi:cytochrome P450
LIIEAGEPSEKDQAPVLFPDAVMGNIFILLFAGHEANVNTLHFAIILLACYPSILKAMQADIDRITSGEQSADEAVSWNYEDKYRSLTNSLVGAVMNETLRLYSVVPVLTKTTLENPQSIILNGATHVIPSNTIILVNKSATHRNPKFWPPSRKSSRAGNPSALGDFDPYQWIVRDDDGSQGLFRPVPGSFLGFGEGSRGCLGKSFGQTELCAFLARLFKDYSVELAVDDLLIGDTDDVKRVKWKARRDEAEREMSDSVQFHMSLRLTGKVPVRFVKRGQETFAHLGH